MSTQVIAMEFGAKKGTKVIKVIGIAALIGIIFAVGRIVFRVFSEKRAATDPHEGA